MDGSGLNSDLDRRKNPDPSESTKKSKVLIESGEPDAKQSNFELDWHQCIMLYSRRVS